MDEATTAVYPEGMTAVNDPTLTGQFPLDYETISRTERVMDDAHLPTLSDGKRILVVTPTGKKQLKDDPQFAHYAEAHKEISPMFPGYFTTCSGFHCCVNNMLAQTDNSSSVEVHYGHAIAPGALGIGMGRPPRVRNSTDDNYGESQKLIWIADHGFKLLDESFVVSVRHTEDTQN